MEEILIFQRLITTMLCPDSPRLITETLKKSSRMKINPNWIAFFTSSAILQVRKRTSGRKKANLNRLAVMRVKWAMELSIPFHHQRKKDKLKQKPNSVLLMTQRHAFELIVSNSTSRMSLNWFRTHRRCTSNYRSHIMIRSIQMAMLRILSRYKAKWSPWTTRTTWRTWR